MKLSKKISDFMIGFQHMFLLLDNKGR